MEITSDIVLKGATWEHITEKYAFMFRATNYMLFMLAIPIGIMYDQRIKDFEDLLDDSKDVFRTSVPRTVITNRDNGKLDFMFQAAIMSTMTEDLPEEKRLELAFGEKTEFNKISFLIEFANFGATILEEQIGETDIETMDNLKHFMVKTYEYRNFDINPLPDEYLIDLVEEF